MRATFAGGCGSTASGAAKATEIAPHWNARRFGITASKPTGGTRRRYGGTSRKSNRGDGGPAVLIELVGGRSIAHASAFISPQREPSSQIASLEWEGRDLCAAINLERDGH